MDTKFFRTFQWMLSPDQKTELQKCINAAIVHHRAQQFKVAGSIKDGDAPDESAKMTDSSTIGTSSSSKTGSDGMHDAGETSMTTYAPPILAPMDGNISKKKMSDKDLQKDLLMSLLKKAKVS